MKKYSLRTNLIYICKNGKTELKKIIFVKKIIATTSLFDKKVVPLRPNSINIMSNSLTFKKL